jgi:hypothetical protein
LVSLTTYPSPSSLCTAAVRLCPSGPPRLRRTPLPQCTARPRRDILFHSSFSSGAPRWPPAPPSRCSRRPRFSWPLRPPRPPAAPYSPVVLYPRGPVRSRMRPRRSASRRVPRCRQPKRRLLLLSRCVPNFRRKDLFSLAKIVRWTGKSRVLLYGVAVAVVFGQIWFT